MSRSRYTPEQKQHPVTQWRHSGRYAQSMPKDWSGGTLVTDDYAGYNALHARADITEAGCRAHARRKFFEQYLASANTTATGRYS